LKILKTFSVKLRLFSSDVRLFQRTRGFLKLFPDKWKFFSLIWNILCGTKKCRVLFRNVRLLKCIFREENAFLNYYGDFLKIMRLFEDISREMEASV
jgi:hypothetical protein